MLGSQWVTVEGPGRTQGPNRGEHADYEWQMSTRQRATLAWIDKD